MENPDEEADNVAVAAAVRADDDLTNYDDNPLVDGELEQEIDPDILHNPDVSTSSKQLKKEKQDAERKENKDGKHNNLKTTLLFSGAVIAIVGTIFAILKKDKTW